MKRIFLLPLLAIAIALGVSAQNSKTPDAGRRQYQVFGEIGRASCRERV